MPVWLFSKATASGTGFREGVAAETRVRQIEAMLDAAVNDMNTKITDLGTSLTTVQNELDKVKICNDNGLIYDPDNAAKDANECVSAGGGGGACQVCFYANAGGGCGHSRNGWQCSEVSRDGEWKTTPHSRESNGCGGRYVGGSVRIRCE